MTLATHIVVGATAAKVFTHNPATAFLVGCLTHYILDSITHWDYKISSLQPVVKTSQNGQRSINSDQVQNENKIYFSKDIILDGLKVLTDATLGFIFVFCAIWFARQGSLGQLFSEIGIYEWSVIIFGAIGGATPDFLQFVYAVWKNPILRQHQRFHNFMHSKKNLNDRPAIGVPIQIAIIVFVSFLLISLYK